MNNFDNIVDHISEIPSGKTSVLNTITILESVFFWGLWKYSPGTIPMVLRLSAAPCDATKSGIHDPWPFPHGPDEPVTHRGPQCGSALSKASRS